MVPLCRAHRYEFVDMGHARIGITVWKLRFKKRRGKKVILQVGFFLKKGGLSFIFPPFLSLFPYTFSPSLSSRHLTRRRQPPHHRSPEETRQLTNSARRWRVHPRSSRAQPAFPAAGSGSFPAGKHPTFSPVSGDFSGKWWLLFHLFRAIDSENELIFVSWCLVL